MEVFVFNLNTIESVGPGYATISGHERKQRLFKREISLTVFVVLILKWTLTDLPSTRNVARTLKEKTHSLLKVEPILNTPDQASVALKYPA